MKTKLEVQLVNVTPEVARNYLRSNKKNRKVSDKQIRFLVKEMLAGRFLENGESIVFDTNGELKDGQHRLMAIIKSGTWHRIPVVTGVEPKSMATFDTGKSRSAGDVLTLNGFKYCNVLSGLISSINKFGLKKSKAGQNRGESKDEGLTNQQILNYCSDNYHWLENIIVKSQLVYNKQGKTKVLGLKAIAILSYMIGGETPENYVFDFLNNLCGNSRTADTAPSYLYTKLYNSKINKEPLNFYWILGMSIKAYNYFIDGNPAVKYFKFKVNQKLPTVLSINN
jgi:hypothetical protein